MAGCTHFIKKIRMRWQKWVVCFSEVLIRAGSWDLYYFLLCHLTKPVKPYCIHTPPCVQAISRRRPVELVAFWLLMEKSIYSCLLSY